MALGVALSIALGITLAGCAAGPTTPSGVLTSAGVTAPPRTAAPVDPAVAEEARRQAEFAIQQEAGDFSRLQALFWPLNRAAAPLCASRAVASIGPLPGSLTHVGEASRPLLRRMLGIEERLTFTEVVDHTPAARAGIRPGDLVMAVDGAPLPVATTATRAYVDALTKAAAENRSVSLDLRRRGLDFQVKVPVERVCAYAVSLTTGDAVTAYASGRRVLVTRGMMRFANDRELAAVLAHEVAHIALGHTAGAASGGTRNATPAAPANLDPTYPTPREPTASPAKDASLSLGEQRARSQARELDADVLGIYLLSAAGMPLRDAAQLWRRIAASYPSTIQHSHLRTHPASPERFVELERTIREVQARRQAAQPLVARLRADGAQTVTVRDIAPSGPWAVNWVNERFVSPLAADPAAPAGQVPANTPHATHAPHPASPAHPAAPTALRDER